MRIFNTQVYGLDESVIRSGYPMKTEILDFKDYNIHSYNVNDYIRAKKLGHAKAGSGHDTALKGIVVQADFEAPQYFWMQFGRYHFSDIISSQSKMHRITKMNLHRQCNEWVDVRIIKILEELIAEYNTYPDKLAFHRIISNVPMGLNLTAGITTNYLELKTMYSQRKEHKMMDWSVDFARWCESLPKFKELVLD